MLKLGSKQTDNRKEEQKNAPQYAPMAELADAPDLGSGVPDVKVQVLFGAPDRNNTNLDESRFVFFFTRDYFGVQISFR